ncbi:MAG: DUF4097 domain-containing protein [Candidatus Eisenbacteria bacterium]|uniref:DUF4097 domain-containing protein n=1 Tax=Eiseniibacteriota bacterium TaxID=2212470 RepID=A0A538SQ75_UNCEI|nr:MAG: DUF4097 domain-containing protein [Candidatus Eisenbacteria bacterium]
MRGTAHGSHLLEGPEVSIYNIAGGMRVLEGTGPSVRVEVLPGGRDGGRLTVEETTVKGLPALRVIYPDSRIVYREYGFGPPNGISSDSYLGYGGRRIHVSGRGPGLDAHADIQVFVPHGKRVHLHLAVGRAWISDVQGDVTFESASSSLEVERLSGALAVQVGSGSIRVSRTKGPIAAETGSGDILIREVDGNVSVEAGSGNIELRRVGADRIAVDAGSGAIVGSEIQVSDMSADCASGEVDLDGASAGRLSIDAGSGSVRLRLTKNIDALVVDAGSGSVRLEAPGDLSARFKIECPKKHLHIDFPVEIERDDDDVAVGRIGSGKGRIDIDAGSGRVELVRR